jgi:hypothetical protein
MWGGSWKLEVGTFSAHRNCWQKNNLERINRHELLFDRSKKRRLQIIFFFLVCCFTATCSGGVVLDSDKIILLSFNVQFKVAVSSRIFFGGLLIF